MEKKTIYWIIGIVVVVLLAFAVGKSITGNVVADTDTEGLAKHLTEQGFKMYGAYWCGHCSDQKEMFGNSWKYVDYVECESEEGMALCQAAGIRGYPTWQLPDGTLDPGVKSLEELAVLSGYN